MNSITHQLVGSHLAQQTGEAATQQRQPERVLNRGSAGDSPGDSPAPVGDSPTGTAPSHVAKRPFSLPRTLVSVPAGGSPDGTGGSPVLPETIFQTRSQAKCRRLSSVTEWIEQIQTLWGNGAESRLELASLLSTIRNHLRPRRGDWSSLWESGEIPFSKRKAEKLVVVGDGLGWAVNANACSHLPTEWNVLYYIAKLGRNLQERLIEKRVIRPSLTVGQARDLFARFHGVTLKNRSRKTRFRERLRRFEDFFLAELPNCSQAEKDFARARLTGLIELIDVPVPYVFTVAAGILPAVEPGILPGGTGVLSEKTLAIWRLRPGGKMPPAAAAKLAAATHLLATVNTYPVPNGNPSFPVSITHFSLLTDQRYNL